MENKIVANILKSSIEWLKDNKYAAFSVVFLFLTLKVLSSLPYFNLLFKDSFFVFSPVIFLAALFLNLKTTRIVLIYALLFTFSLILFLIEQYAGAETVANYIYVILLALTIKGILDIKDTPR